MKLSTGRKAIVYALLAMLIGGHAYDVVTSKEHWPFSPYPMYSDTQTGRLLHVTKLIGLCRNGKEIPLNGTFVCNSLSVWQTGNQQRRDRITQAARESLLAYRQQREQNRRLPRIVSVRVYQYTWRLGEAAPATRTLIAEASHHTKHPHRHKHVTH